MNNDNKKKQRRYNLVVPEELYAELEKLAGRNSSTVVEIIRKFLKLGLIISKYQESPETEFIIRENGKEKNIILV